MARFAPFEPAPRLAVGVSGGADSLALLLLLDDWTRARGGSLLALTVDHGLRAEAAGEAAWVGRCCAARGIAHRVLSAAAPEARPAGGLQAAARDTRYRLLAAACREAGVLHLLLAHQLEDQGETFLLRLAAGSGPAGLSAMPAMAFLDDLRILRPLLGQPRRALEALLRGAGQPWLEDPSNTDPAFARARLRAARASLAATGLSPSACAGLAEVFGRLRAWSETAEAALLAESCRLDPRGFAWLARGPLLGAPPPLAQGALAALLRCLAGRRHAPRGPKLARLLAALRDEGFRGTTLAGCRILPRRGERLLVVREPAAIGPRTEPPAKPARPGLLWDGRFRLAGAAGGSADPAPVAALGPAQRRALLAPQASGDPLATVPAAARDSLPTYLPTSRDLDGRVALPHFSATWSEMVDQAPAAQFAPRRALTAASFTVFR
ncbi:MAG: tRNA lysidine(34) synthetase TilS [Tistlia sp.]|uniref:tRNA lysidine(34) synthetase TilS n=1 Tax=Tistlia sp. TaxID=3057121 RepID=UPI0034A186A4